MVAGGARAGRPGEAPRGEIGKRGFAGACAAMGAGARAATGGGANRRRPPEK